MHFTVRDVIKIRHIADQLRIASDEVKDSGVPEKYIHDIFPIVFVACSHSTSQTVSLQMCGVDGYSRFKNEFGLFSSRILRFILHNYQQNS